MIAVMACSRGFNSVPIAITRQNSPMVTSRLGMLSNCVEFDIITPRCLNISSDARERSACRISLEVVLRPLADNKLVLFARLAGRFGLLGLN